MKIKSSLFDELEFDEKDIITLEQGMIGFDGLKRFVLMDFADESVFHWLQSIDEPDVGFIVSEPTIFDGDYTFVIDPDLKDILRIEKEDEVVVMTIVTIKDSGSSVTGNLLGPVIVNASRHVGCQIALEPGKYSTATPLRQIEAEQMQDKEKVGCTA
ncbi:MAG: flagellar assembly protein FliW [Candidatus Krumholzibacteriota bacterium]|nr:flagellar assembly protein FliW [Candidatus Krumholzibacteriota bacterium]